jgi:hypothetical protein
MQRPPTEAFHYPSIYEVKSLTEHIPGSFHTPDSFQNKEKTKKLTKVDILFMRYRSPKLKLVEFRHVGEYNCELNLQTPEISQTEVSQL